MQITPDRIERVILASVQSTSGKYRLILAQHIVHGMFCYDVLSLNNLTSEVLCRHYNNQPCSDEANKAAALAYYDEMRDKLTAPRAEDESDEPKEEMNVVSPRRPFIN